MWGGGRSAEGEGEEEGERGEEREREGNGGKGRIKNRKPRIFIEGHTGIGGKGRERVVVYTVFTYESLKKC